jgi:hypothetical protein
MREVLFRLPIVLVFLAALVGGCSYTEPTMSEEARCRQTGGMWRSTAWDQSGGGGGGGY